MRTALTAVKTVDVAATPSAMDSSAMAVTDGVRRKNRSASRMSWKTDTASFYRVQQKGEQANGVREWRG